MTSEYFVSWLVILQYFLPLLSPRDYIDIRAAELYFTTEIECLSVFSVGKPTTSCSPRRNVKGLCLVSGEVSLAFLRHQLSDLSTLLRGRIKCSYLPQDFKNKMLKLYPPCTVSNSTSPRRLLRSALQRQSTKVAYSPTLVTLRERTECSRDSESAEEVATGFQNTWRQQLPCI
jgi:hypothetical protein